MSATTGARVVVLESDEPGPVHLMFVEADGRPSPLRHRPSAALAVRYVEAATSIVDPNVAARRTWLVSPCDCGSTGGSS